jgi:energy coupling factor transporter S component ThiW
MEKMEKARKIALTAFFASLAIVLSGVHIPVGPFKAFPFQHMANALAGVVIGPWYAALSALIAAIIRNAIGTGTIFAFPGGIPGAIVVGLVYTWVRRDWAVWTEPIGTIFIGVGLSVLAFGPIMGKQLALYTFLFAFALSSISGAGIGYFLLKALRKAKVLHLPSRAEAHPPIPRS